MKYDHVLYDSMLKILQHAKERLKARGNGTMYAEVDRVYQSGINNFSLPQTQLAWALTFLCTEPELLPGIGLDTLNDDESAPALADDLKATSTEAGKKAVKEAHKRLVKAAKRKPITDAEAIVAKAETIEKEKRVAAEAARAEREKPDRELTEAKKEVKEAAATFEEGFKRSWRVAFLDITRALDSHPFKS